MIKCEPVDVTVQPGQKAVFEVDARGKNLLYQWYFNDKPMGSEKGGRERVLVIPSARESDMGSYYAEIESTDLYGGPIGVRTRSASLSLGGSPNLEPGLYSLTGTNPPVTYPPQQGTIVTLYPNSTGPCGNYCAYFIFNNGGLGYAPLFGHNRGELSVHTGGCSGPVIPNTQYDVFWRVNATTSGCATNFGTDKKRFPVAYPKVYVLTIYFRPPCPTPPIAICINDLTFSTL